MDDPDQNVRLYDIIKHEKKPTNATEEMVALDRRINATRMELEDDIYEKSTMVKFYQGKVIFLTGAAGFLGQVYLEKLLRIGVSKVYVLLRAKKNLSPMERVQQICAGPLYQRLRAKDPNFIDRIHVIHGDLEELKVGMSDEDIKKICDEVHIVIHAAADVRFNIPLMNLVKANIRGTLEILEICKKMKRLESFAYVSTAYSHCPRDKIEEKFYDPPMDPYFWLKVLEHCTSEKDKEILEIIEPHIMQPWPNSYTYAKACSEKIVKDYSVHFPTVVIRPSIVVSTYQDPIPGWTNNITGINGLCVGIGVGFIRHLHVTNDFIIDIICADFVCNTTFASVWIAAEKYHSTKKIPEPEVYHVTSRGFFLTSERLGTDSIAMREFEILHSMKSIYYPVITFTHYEWQDELATLFLQALPSFIMDFFNKEKIKLLAVSRKVKSMKNVIAFFMNKRITFDHKNVTTVYDRMSDVDKRLFPADARNLNWNKFIYPYFAGMRVYVLLDSLDTYAKSKTYLRKLKYIHYTVKYFFFSLLIWLFYILIVKQLLNMFYAT